MDSSLALRANIKKLMAHKGLSQRALAHNSGVSQKTISNIVAGNGVLNSPSVATVESIAGGLGVTLSELLNYTTSVDPFPEEDAYSNLSGLIRDFMAADPEGRKAILRVARNEAINAAC
tara:strand:+ start:955 stop:1311 length:357 start_codon:yes stop_codon:yes gene_type:complete